jgi:chloramphenicol 3-O phosphotransferase
MKSGRVIIINGGSSTGKTTMALEFQEIMYEPYFLLGIDSFWVTMPEKEIDLERVTPRYYKWCQEETEEGQRYYRILPGQFLNEIMLARYKSMAAYLDRGLNVVADEVFWSRDWLLESLRVFKPYECFYVGLFCEDQELLSREIQRGDRYIGWARGSQIYCHKDALYDLRIDNTYKRPQECAEALRHLIESGGVPTAAGSMRRKFEID